MNEKMREDFEAWHRSVVEGDPPHEKYDSGDYRNQHVQRYWIGWKASREALVIELPGACECCHDQSAIDMNEACAQAIEAAGLKVQS